MKINVKKNAFKGIKSGLLSRVIIIVPTFLYRTVIIYFLGSEYLGLDGLFSSIFVFLSIAELGIGEVVVQSMYSSVAADDLERIGSLLNIYDKFLKRISIAIFAVGMAIIPFLPYFIKDREYPSEINVTVLYILFLVNLCSEYAVLAYKTLIYQAIQRTDIINNTFLVSNIIKTIMQILAIIFFHNYYLAVLAIIFATILKNIIIAIKATKDYPQIVKLDKEITISDRKRISDNLKSSFGQRLFGRVVSSSDIVTISIILGLNAVADYSNYVYILNSLMGLLNIFISSLIAGVGNLITTKDSESNHKDLIHITFSYNLIVSWCTITCVCLFQPFIKIWVGVEMMLPFRTMLLLAAYFLLWHIKDTLSLYKDAAGIWRMDRMRPYVCSVINIFLNLLLINLIGIDGVIIATIISDFVISFPWIVYVMRTSFFKEGLNDYYWRLADCIIMTVVVCGITYFACSFIPSGTLLEIVLRLIVCVIVPGLLFYIRYRKTEMFSWLVGIARNMIYPV